MQSTDCSRWFSPLRNQWIYLLIDSINRKGIFQLVECLHYHSRGIDKLEHWYRSRVWLKIERAWVGLTLADWESHQHGHDWWRVEFQLATHASSLLFGLCERFLSKPHHERRSCGNSWSGISIWTVHSDEFWSPQERLQDYTLVLVCQFSCIVMWT